jgi:ketosteroid isomerase-like protein
MKKNAFLTQIAFAFLMIFVVACSQPPAEAPAEAPAIDMEALKTEIQAMEDAYAAAEKAKNADGVVAYYSDDAVSYSRNEEPTSGKTAIRDRIADRLAKDTMNVTNVYKVIDLFAEGNMAVEIGSWSEQDSTGKETNKGYYMSYFEKRDGKYVCVRDMNVKVEPPKEEKPQ